ncbi:hypothetical protein F5B21DRAFT_13432 [Xylaria acuta]|nr:hypothetical protein F5B21DRAFT_13432 [Xylaria acuta]
MTLPVAVFTCNGGAKMPKWVTVRATLPKIEELHGLHRVLTTVRTPTRLQLSPHCSSTYLIYLVGHPFPAIWGDMGTAACQWVASAWLAPGVDRDSGRMCPDSRGGANRAAGGWISVQHAQRCRNSCAKAAQLHQSRNSPSTLVPFLQPSCRAANCEPRTPKTSVSRPVELFSTNCSIASRPSASPPAAVDLPSQLARAGVSKRHLDP